jgi:hypothetical protein
MALRGTASISATASVASQALTHGISIQSGDIVLLLVSCNNSPTTLTSSGNVAHWRLK